MPASRQEKGGPEAHGTTSPSSLSARQGTSGLSALPRGGRAKGGAGAARGSWGAPCQGACDVLPVRRLASRSCRVLSLRAVKVTAGGHWLAFPPPIPAMLAARRLLGGSLPARVSVRFSGDTVRPDLARSRGARGPGLAVASARAIPGSVVPSGEASHLPRLTGRLPM